MYINITGSTNNKDVYIYQSYRKENGKTSSRIYKKLGKFNDLIAQFDGDKDKMMAWAKSEARKETELYNQKNGTVSVDFSQGARIALNEQRLFNTGYLFLQCLASQLRLDKICRSIKSRYKFQYDLHAIFTDLIYARILHPSSKRESYEYCKTLPEPPKYSLQDVYRSLSVLAAESDFIQSELYRNSNFVHPRNKKILYYDCTNFYFEIEEEDELRKYGKSKEHRPNPIVTMGLFMDADGLPLSFDIFPGNQNEQTTLKPLEQKIIRDFNCSEFIFCSDSGLGSLNNRRFNSFSNRAYVITHSLKRMKEDDRKAAIDGIRYVKLDGQEYYVQEIFDTTELLANLDRNAVKVEHSVYDYVVYDSSTVEKPVAVALDNDPDVKMFFKIPSRFKIETPIGTYNPDWAVYLNKNGEEKLYFVLETKGDTSFMHLKTSEQLKIHCGKEHFKALDAGVGLETATSWTELRKRI